MMKKYIFVIVAALLVAIAVLYPKPSYALLGDVTVVRTTTCSATQCVRTEVVYMETIVGITIMSVKTETYERNPSTKER